MTARALTAVVAARKAADFLDGIGEQKRANDVRRVCRSNDGQRVALQRLYADNMGLRRQMEGRADG